MDDFLIGPQIDEIFSWYESFVNNNFDEEIPEEHDDWNRFCITNQSSL